jgi:predicted RecA/RadA family phage recombinase
MSRLLTILARPFGRGRRALPVLLCAFLALAASCSKDYENCPDCPGSPALIPGTFVLQSVDSFILPYTPPNTTVTFIAGDCVTTGEAFTLSLTTVSNGKDTVTKTATGFVLPYNKGTVTFHFAASDVQAQAEINGLGFTITYAGMSLLFARQG